MRILALQLKRIGDAILTAPALAGLRKAVPEARVELILSGAACGLAELFRGTVAGVHCMHQGKWNVGIWRKALSGKWDAVLDFSGTDRSASLGLVTRAPVRLGYQKDARNKLRLRAWSHLCTAKVRELHTVDFHHALVNSFLELHSLKSHPVMDPGHLYQAPVNLPPLPAKYAVVHPGTARTEKYWPAANWIRVVEELQGRHQLPVVLTGTADPEEAAHLQEILSQSLVYANLAGQLSLTELAAVISQANLVMGVDSAAMHLASAYRRPQIALFGPTNPYHWRPRHDKARVVLAAGPELRADTPHHKKAAMEELLPSWVLGRVEELLG